MKNETLLEQINEEIENAEQANAEEYYDGQDKDEVKEGYYVGDFRSFLR